MGDMSGSTCSRHNEEAVTAFCTKHGQTLCMKCLLGAHKVCVHENHVEYINDTAARAESEVPEVIRTYEYLTTSSKQWLDKYQNTLESLKQTEHRLVSGIKQMRQRMIEQTNLLAEDALEIVNSVVEDQRAMVQNDIDQLEDFDRKVKDIKTDIERCKAADDLVIGELLNVVNTVKNLHSRFQHTELIERDVKVHFYISEELEYMRNKLRSFGELCVEDPNCRNTGMRSRPSRVSLEPSLSLNSSNDDEIDTSVFVMPKTKQWDISDINPYCSIHVEQITPCPKPPPLPNMHPDKPFEETHAFDYNRDKYQTLPTMKLKYEDTATKETKSVFTEYKPNVSIPIPPLPKKRISLREPTSADNVVEKNISNHDVLSLLADKGATKDEIESDSELTIDKGMDEDVKEKTAPEIKVRPPTITKKLAEMFEKKAFVETTKLTPKFKGSPHSHMKRLLGPAKSGSDSSINVLRDSGILVSGDEIPPLPKMHRQRFSVNRKIDSIISTDTDYGHSDNECSPNISLLSANPQKSSSFSSLTDAGEKIQRPSVSSGSSMDTTRSFYSASSNASVMSFDSKDTDSFKSEETLSTDTNVMRQKQTEVRFVPPLDTKSRKSVNYNLMFSLPSLSQSSKTPLSPRHSTITGIAVTNSDMLFICDIENHCLQLFDTAGIPLYDYQIKEPFSCCTIREDVVAVTSKERKSLCIFDISGGKISCQKEQFVDTAGDIFGVGYTKGFYGICCVDSVIIITETLQPYRTVKPMVMTKKRRSKTFFVDVKYVALEWTKLGFFIYTSEHKIDRVSCVVVGSRDRPVWNCHVGKPKSLLVTKENVLVAGNHKIVVLEAASGQRLREIHHEVPTHPVHMVLRSGWLYISKNSSSNTESRNIRKIPFITE